MRNEVQRQRNEFGAPLPVHVTVELLCDKFRADGTVQNVNKGCSGRPHSSTDNGSVETLLQAFTQSLRKSVRLHVHWQARSVECYAMSV
jgi:hypothetical protein